MSTLCVFSVQYRICKRERAPVPSLESRMQHRACDGVCASSRHAGQDLLSQSTRPKRISLNFFTGWTFQLAHTYHERANKGKPANDASWQCGSGE